MYLIVTLLLLSTLTLTFELLLKAARGTMLQKPLFPLLTCGKHTHSGLQHTRGLENEQKVKSTAMPTIRRLKGDRRAA